MKKLKYLKMMASIFLVLVIFIPSTTHAVESCLDIELSKPHPKPYLIDDSRILKEIDIGKRIPLIKGGGKTGSAPAAPTSFPTSGIDDHLVSQRIPTEFIEHH